MLIWSCKLKNFYLVQSLIMRVRKILYKSFRDEVIRELNYNPQMEM